MHTTQTPATIRYENLAPLEGWNCDLRSFNADRPQLVASALQGSARNHGRCAKSATQDVDRPLAGERSRFAAVEQVAAGAGRFDDVGDADADQPPRLSASLGRQHFPRRSKQRPC